MAPSYSRGGMKLPAGSRTPRWNPPSRTSPPAPRKGRTILSHPSDFMVRWTSSVDLRSCTLLPPLENLPNSRFLSGRWRRIGKTGGAARTVVELIVETLVTTSGWGGTTLARTSRTPASAAPMADSNSDFSRRDNRIRLVAFRDGRCDNDDATFNSFSYYILGDV